MAWLGFGAFVGGALSMIAIPTIRNIRNDMQKTQRIDTMIDEAEQNTSLDFPGLLEVCKQCNRTAGTSNNVSGQQMQRLAKIGDDVMTREIAKAKLGDGQRVKIEQEFQKYLDQRNMII